jgi:hypothetical protein
VERNKVKQRMSMNEGPISFSGVGLGGSAGKEVSTENAIAEVSARLEEQEEEMKSNLSEVRFRKQAKEEEKAKLKSRYSGDPSCSSDSPTRKNYPSCLRNFC